MVVEHDHDWVESQAQAGRELEAGHLECPIADEHEGPEGWARHLHPHGSGDAESH